MRELVIATITALSLCSAFGAETLDSQMSTLAQTLAAKIKESGRKKVAVLDFSDLQGKNVTEFGRYIADQLTFNLVSNRKDFSIVDRANLKRILDEHKLTISGLVDPENAKKLGQISGVDALILGNVTPLKNDVQVTAKIIATDTAEIVGAGQSRVAKDDEVNQLLGHAIESGGRSSVEGDTTSGGSRPSKDFTAPGPAKLDNLQVELLSFKLLSGHQASAALQIKNASKQNTMAVAANQLQFRDGFHLLDYVSAKIVDDNGNDIRAVEAAGVPLLEANSGFSTKSGFAEIRRLMSTEERNLRGKDRYWWASTMAEIKPGGTLEFTLDFKGGSNRPQVENQQPLGRVLTLQCDLITIVKSPGNAKPNPKLESIYFKNINITPLIPPAAEETK